MRFTELFENNLLVRLIEEPAIAKSSMILSDAARAELMEDFPMLAGEVVMAGPGVFRSDGTRFEMSCRVGDVVSFPPGVGPSVSDDGHPGEKMMLLTDKALVGIVEPSEEVAAPLSDPSPIFSPANP